jgi:hypothetical protein
MLNIKSVYSFVKPRKTGSGPLIRLILWAGWPLKAELQFPDKLLVIGYGRTPAISFVFTDVFAGMYRDGVFRTRYPIFPLVAGVYRWVCPKTEFAVHNPASRTDPLIPAGFPNVEF